MGIAVNLHNKTLNAFLTDGEFYASDMNDGGRIPSPHLWNTVYLGTHAIAMFRTLADALVSVQQAKARLTESLHW